MLMLENIIPLLLILSGISMIFGGGIFIVPLFLGPLSIVFGLFLWTPKEMHEHE